MSYLSCFNDAGGQQLLSDVLVLKQHGVVLHVGADAQNVLHLKFTSDTKNEASLTSISNGDTKS